MKRLPILKNILKKLSILFLELIIAVWKCIKTACLVQLNCKHWPSCSEYAREALEIHSPFKATSLILKRIMRCHVFSKGGVDLVPPVSC